MRNSLIESLVIGCGVALGVMLVHVLTQGASVMTQLLALLAVGVVLFCVQIALTQRSTRRDRLPPEEPDEQQPRSGSLRRRRRNPFARELTDDWIGLEDHSTEREPAEPYAPGDLDDLWAEPPDVPVQKAAAKVDDQR
jgi:hypothetical protein